MDWVLYFTCVWCAIAWPLGMWCGRLYERRRWLERQRQPKRWEITTTPPKGTTCKEVLEECYAAGGYAWDKIDDPIAYLREIE